MRESRRDEKKKDSIEEEKGRKEKKLLPENDVEDVPTGNPVAITVIAISPFILSSTSAPNMMFALGSTAS